MKGFSTLIIIMLCAGLFAQDTAEKSDGKKASQIASKLADGYENLVWGVLLSKARDNTKGKLYFTDEKSIIITKDGELEYNYGFLYQDPAVMAAADKNAKESKPSPPSPDAGGQKEAVDEGRLFFVSLKFPYLSLDVVRKKIEEKYGPSTNESLNNFQGAIAWNGDKTILVLWVDRYENKPFSRRLIYISKASIKETADYNFKYFNRVELDLIKKFNP